MKNNNGFTLIELLVVIAILSIVVVIAVPSIAGINNLINQNMREQKAKIIEEAATLKGEDAKASIINSTMAYKSVYPCISTTVDNLVPNYLENDTGNACLSSGGTGCIVDPSDKTKFMDELKVIIYYKNRRIHAVVDLNNELSCS